MIQKFTFTFKLFHNSSNKTPLGEVTFNTNTGKFIFNLEPLDTLPSWMQTNLDKGIKTMIRNFNKDDEYEQKKYPIRYDDDFCLELIYKNAYK